MAHRRFTAALLVSDEPGTTSDGWSNSPPERWSLPYRAEVSVAGRAQLGPVEAGVLRRLCRLDDEDSR